ncbi:BTB/POZ domain-containing protein kctd1 [Mactra antiquata]
MMAEEFPNIIELNAGGQMMTTKLDTLLKDSTSILAAVFTGKTPVEKDKDGRYFIDCDGDTFKYILEFLRFGVIPPAEKALKVYRYACIFKLRHLKNILERYYAVRFRGRMLNVIEGLGENRRVYEELKDKILTDIGDTNFSDKTLIPIVFILNDDKDSCDKNHSFMICSQLSNLTEIKNLKIMADKCIPMQTVYTDDISDISRCLAFELCELGYCKQGFYYDKLRKETCRRSYNCTFTWKIEFVFLSREIFAGDKGLKRP